MDRATLSQRIESILNEITRLSNTLYAMDNTNTNALLSCVSPHFHLNAADGAELCALAAAYAAFRLHGGVAATAHLDGPQWTGIFTHTAGDTPRPIYGGQFL